MTTPTPDPTPAPAPAPAPAPSRTLRTVLLLGGSVLLVTVLALVAVQLSLRLTRTDASETFLVSESFDAIEITSDGPRVTVEFDDVAEATVEFTQGDSSRSIRFDHDVRSGVLELAIRDRGWFTWDWNGDFGDEGSELMVTLPKAFDSDEVAISVDSSAGDITLDGTFGDVDVDTTAGGVELVGGAASLTLSTTAGNIDVLDYDLKGDLRSDTTAGNSTFSFRTLPSSVGVASTAGNVEFTVPDGSYRVETDVTAGTVDSGLSSDADGTRVYRFETTAGNLDLRTR